MKRVTRRSYRRSVIMFGIMLFVSIALLSTGFAAWVMSSDALNSPESNITVSTVTESSLQLSVTLDEDHDEIFFAPDKTDETGRVRVGKDDHGNVVESEQLKIKFTGRLNRIDILDKVTVELKATSEVVKQLVDAQEAGYIELPACFNVKSYRPESTVTKIELLPSQLTAAYDGETIIGYDFTVEIEFKWGSMFEHSGTNMNPSVYYDLEDPTIQAITDDEVRSTLLAMRAMILGYTSTGDPVEDALLGTELKFNVEVIAKAN